MSGAGVADLAGVAGAGGLLADVSGVIRRFRRQELGGRAARLGTVEPVLGVAQ